MIDTDSIRLGKYKNLKEMYSLTIRVYEPNIGCSRLYLLEKTTGRAEEYFIPYVNIGCFGKCNVVSSAPKPCTPCGVWMNTSPTVKATEIPILTKDSCIICPEGGRMITITDSGQKIMKRGKTDGINNN